jgi:methyl-accepting chemotaxis protein
MMKGENHSMLTTGTGKPALQSPQQLAASINLPEMLEVLGIDANTRAQGKNLAAILDANGEPIFAKFYERITMISWAYKFKSGEIDGLRKKQLAHWKELFSGPLDVRYVRNATIVGSVHRQKGIEPLLYIVGYSIVKSLFLELIAKMDLAPVDKGRLMMALEKYISLDVGLAMVGYSGHKAFAQLFAPGFAG